MKHLFASLILGFNFSVCSGETLWPDTATKYLLSMDCEFSAFTVYLGPDAGILVKGQVKSIALCANTFEEKGAMKKKFCWLRSLDMKQGFYTSKDKSGSAWREEDTSCNKEVLVKIFNKASVKGQIQFKSFNSEWKVVADKYDVGQSFISLVPKENKNKK